MNEDKKWTDDHLKFAKAVIDRLVKYQETAGLTDRRLVEQFPDLGSTRTWRGRLLAGKFQGLDPERFVHRLKRIAIILDGGLPDAEFFDLPFARRVATAVALLERATTDRRVLVVLAPNGVGKTMAARWLVAQGRGRRVYCRVRPGWRGRELHLANGLIEALGDDALQPNAATAERRLIALLSREPKTVFIDQAHEGGAALMHLIRCLVDETPRAGFVYLGYDTGFRRAQTATTDSLIEAQAFLGRCQRPILDAWRLGVNPRDVAEFLRASGLAKALAEGIAQQVTGVLRQHGNLRLLADAVTCWEMAAESAEDPAVVPPTFIVDEVYRLAGVKREDNPGEEDE